MNRFITPDQMGKDILEAAKKTGYLALLIEDAKKREKAAR